MSETTKTNENKNKESLFHQVHGEFNKVIWPNRTELTKQTTTVIIVSLLFGILVSVMDLVFGYGINTITSLFIN